jgi:hypothetical protein
MDMRKMAKEYRDMLVEVGGLVGVSLWHMPLLTDQTNSKECPSPNASKRLTKMAKSCTNMYLFTG